MAYISWEYYSSLYSEVQEEDFDGLCAKASAKLDVYTHMRARNFEVAFDPETATDFQKLVHTQIQNTVCVDKRPVCAGDFRHGNRYRLCKQCRLFGIL